MASKGTVVTLITVNQSLIVVFRCKLPSDYLAFVKSNLHGVVKHCKSDRSICLHDKSKNSPIICNKAEKHSLTSTIRQAGAPASLLHAMKLLYFHVRDPTHKKSLDKTDGSAPGFIRTCRNVEYGREAYIC